MRVQAQKIATLCVAEKQFVTRQGKKTTGEKIDILAQKPAIWLYQELPITNPRGSYKKNIQLNDSSLPIVKNVLSII